MTATMVMPIALRTGADILFINLQPSESMDHESFDTGDMARLLRCLSAPRNGEHALRELGVAFRSVSGYLHDERALDAN